MANGGVIEQFKIMRAMATLNSPDEKERESAKNALLAIGVASIPSLRRAITPYRNVRLQISAATLLYRLGDPQGIVHLTDLLRHLTSHEGEEELRDAFLQLNPVHSRSILRQEWQLIQDWNTANPVPDFISRLWVTLGDPSFLDLLCRDADRRPSLFLSIAPRFGETAVPAFDRMLSEPSPERRLLAVQALKCVRTPRSFSVLARGLRDFDPQVREAIPRALVEVGGRQSAAEVVLRALDEGFASVSGMSLIAEGMSYPFGHVNELLERWNPHAPLQKVDAPTVRWIVEFVTVNRLDLYLPTFCRLIERRPSPQMTSALLKAIGSRCAFEEEGRAGGLTVLHAHLSHVSPTSREAAATALVPLGFPLGARFVRLLDEAIALRNANLMRNRVGRMAQAAMNLLIGVQRRDAETFTSEEQKQLSLWSVALLRESLKMLSKTQDEREVTETQETVQGTLTLLARLMKKPDTPMRDALVDALHFVRIVRLKGGEGSASFGAGQSTDVGEPIRGLAIGVLQTLYGTDAYPLFVELAFASNPVLQETGIEALTSTSETRALIPLMLLLTHPNSRVQKAAKSAIETIKMGNPEMMTLLRASTSLDPLPQTLLRPVEDNPDFRTDELLRPAPEEKR